MMAFEQDIDFVVFIDGKGNAEIAIRVVRDAKGHTNIPRKRCVSQPGTSAISCPRKKSMLIDFPIPS